MVLFSDYTDQENIVTVEGNTLHVETKGAQNAHEGFAVAPTAKIALIQDTKPTINSVKPMDKIYEYDNGVDGLAKAVKDMNDNKNFKGFISAVFEDGLATSIVIYDRTETVVDQGEESRDPSVTGLFLDNPAHDVMLTYVGSVPGTTAQKNAVEQALLDSDSNIENVTVVDFVDAINVNTPGSYKVTFNMKNGSSTQMVGRILLQNTVAPAAEDIMTSPATDASGVIAHKNHPTDDLNISTQDITMSGNTITVNSGMSLADRAAEKIQNLAISAWGFGGYDKFFLVELTPPAGYTAGSFQAKYSGGHNPAGTYDLTASPVDYPNVLFAYDTTTAHKTGNYVDIRWQKSGETTWTDWTRIWINLPEAANP